MGDGNRFDAMPDCFHSRLLGSRVGRAVGRSCRGKIMICKGGRRITAVDVRLALPSPRHCGSPVRVRRIVRDPGVSLVSSCC